MADEIIELDSAKITFQDGSELENLPVKIFDSWVKLVENGDEQYIPREDIELIKEM